LYLRRRSSAAVYRRINEQLEVSRLIERVGFEPIRIYSFRVGVFGFWYAARPSAAGLPWLRLKRFVAGRSDSAVSSLFFL
jgi:hypothetical protein